MDNFTVFPDKEIVSEGAVSDEFLSLGVKTFVEACRYIHELPYGYNSSKDDPMVVFKEKMGTCTTKHSVIATLAEELDLPLGTVKAHIFRAREMLYKQLRGKVGNY